MLFRSREVGGAALENGRGARFRSTGHGGNVGRQSIGAGGRSRKQAQEAPRGVRAGLGRSDTARFYAIRNAEEARAYLAHPLLGPRLVAAAQAIVAAPGDAATILGAIDAIKLRSSMTLFAAVADDPAPFAAALNRFFDGKRDEATSALLDRKYRRSE